MATIYSTGYNGKPLNQVYRSGKPIRKTHSEFSIATGSASNGDVYVLGGPYSVADRIHRIFAPAGHGALTAADDNDLGFYKMVDGSLVEIDKDVLWDGVDLTSASAVAQDLLDKNGSLDRTQTIGELLSLENNQEPAGGIFLCLTTNTKSSGTFALDVDVEVEMANGI